MAAAINQCMILEDEELERVQKVGPFRGWRQDNTSQITASRLFGSGKIGVKVGVAAQEFPSAFQNYKVKSGVKGNQATAAVAAVNPFPFSVNRKGSTNTAAAYAKAPKGDGTESASKGALISTVRETFQVDPEVESILKIEVGASAVAPQERPYSPHTPTYGEGMV